MEREVITTSQQNLGTQLAALANFTGTVSNSQQSRVALNERFKTKTASEQHPFDVDKFHMMTAIQQKSCE